MNDYKVGYSRPPKNTQLKKGVSGNPSGRSRNQSDGLVKAVDKFRTTKLTYQDGDKIKRATPDEITIDRLFRFALRGDLRAADDLLRLRTSKSLKNTDEEIHIIVEGSLLC